MADNHYTKEEKLIEDIEEYYLSVITRYLGADPEGLVQNLENHNRSWNQWYPKIGDSGKNFFGTGAERVVYMLLNRGDILGDPSSNPLGSDNSFLKYDRHFKQHLAINIDVKVVKANSSFGDFIGNSPIGINQNSYKQIVKYYTKKEKKLVEERMYEPGLDANYQIEDKNYTNITYSIVIMYCDYPIGSNTLTEQRVIAIITNCIPNGQLYKIYKDKVFSPGKSGNLKIKSGQKIDLGNGKFFITDGSEKFQKLKEKYNLSNEKYRLFNGMKKIRWDLDARFNYKKIKFVTLENTRKERVKKIYLKNDLYRKFFYYVSQNEERKEPVNRQKDSIENFEFIENLKFF